VPLVFKQRLITALILAPLVLCGVFLLEPLYFSWFFAFIITLAAWEWANLSHLTSQAMRIIYALLACFLLLVVVDNLSVPWVLSVSIIWWIIAVLLVLSYPMNAGMWQSRLVRVFIGFLVLLPMWKALVFIRGAEFLPVPGLSTLWLILYMLLLVWFADTGAYFAGKTWGNKKLAPNVSPGKSWAGAWGGVAATVILAVISSGLMGFELLMAIKFVFVTVLTAAISIIGDLTESMFKRQRGIKDSSNLLPGHGGVLDRIDSLVAAIPVFVFCLLTLGWVA
jgi:phosphatidate cytidylyltransferase